MIFAQQTRHRKEPLVPKSTDGVIEVLSVVGDITNVMTIDRESFVEVETTSNSASSEHSGVRPRKRAKLDHMSSEEKAQHRKMMNRISAQTARDRQKAQMQQQEVDIQILKDENDTLREKNVSLNNKCEELKRENEKMAALLREYEAKMKLTESFGAMKTEVKMEIADNTVEEYGNGRSLFESSLEPAVPRTVPLPKGPELLNESSCLLLMLLACFRWILTHPNSSKPSTTSHSKFLAQALSSPEVLKKLSPQTQLMVQELIARFKDPG